jgi:hypothetical protein
MMEGYATYTGTKRNQKALRLAGWRWIVTPDTLTRYAWRRPKWDDGTPAPYALDNGAWGCFQRGEEWDEANFLRSLRSVGVGADWVVLPDIVGAGLRSLERSLAWLPRIEGQVLLPVQDGMEVSDIAPHIGGRVGVFVGGSTEWKLATMHQWCQLANRAGATAHVGRVNTVRRIRQCSVAGAHSFDGTSCTRFAVNVPILDAARRRCTLFYPRVRAGSGQVQGRQNG